MDVLCAWIIARRSHATRLRIMILTPDILPISRPCFNVDILFPSANNTSIPYVSLSLSVMKKEMHSSEPGVGSVDMELGPS